MKDNAEEIENLAITLLSNLVESGPNLGQLLLLRDIPVLRDECHVFYRVLPNEKSCKKFSSTVSTSKNQNSDNSTIMLVNHEVSQSKDEKYKFPVKSRTCLDLARLGHSRKFLSHSAVKTLVDNVWLGQIVGPPKWKKYFLIIIGLLIFTLPIIFKFLEMKKDRKRISLSDRNKLVSLC